MMKQVQFRYFQLYGRQQCRYSAQFSSITSSAQDNSVTTYR